MTKPIALVQGAWLNSASWVNWKAHYEGEGYIVVAPDWPYDDRPPAELRASPRKELAHLGQRKILEHFEKIIRALPESPILIWHSLSGVLPINWTNPKRAPLLLIAGGKDLIADASITEGIYKKQKRAPSKTEFKLFPERSHWTCMDPGWEEVADYALSWAEANARAV